MSVCLGGPLLGVVATLGIVVVPAGLLLLLMLLADLTAPRP